MVEHRMRIKDEELEVLERAVLIYIRDLARQHKTPPHKLEELAQLWNRLSWGYCGRAGRRGKYGYHHLSIPRSKPDEKKKGYIETTPDDWLKNVEEWVAGEILAKENPEEYQRKMTEKILMGSV